jgi:hypothetical protein
MYDARMSILRHVCVAETVQNLISRVRLILNSKDFGVGPGYFTA